MSAVTQKLPSFYSEDIDEPLMFCLNEEDEEDDPSQSDSGKKVKIFRLFLRSLSL